jgi:ribulose-phosphate 3-epimerase
MRCIDAPRCLIHVRTRLAASSVARVRSTPRSLRPCQTRPDALSTLPLMDRMRELIEEPRVAPSILSADFGRLGEQVDEVMDAGARVIHFDVMDGHFVPPITIGPLVLAGIADRVHAAGGAVDVHLMIEAPERQIEEFAKAGADSITFHDEATPHANRTLHAIRELGCLAGVAINPGTPVEALSELRGLADVVLCMSVNPGWGGQSFIESSPGKVERLRQLDGEARIEVDGGLDVETVGSVAAAGASLFVAGSAIFGAPDPAQAYRDIAAAAGAA